MSDLNLNLKNLVQESRQLTNHILPTGLTPLERGLEQIKSQTKRLMKRVAVKDSTSRIVDNRTAYLLASRGIDTDKVLDNLVDINLGLTFEPLHGVPDTDVDLYLRNEHETLVSLAIEESRNQTVADFEINFELSMQKDWNKQKRKIMENMGQNSLTHLDNAKNFDGNILGLGMPSGMVTEGDLSANPRLMAYAAVVKDLNDARLNQQPFNVISAFRKASSKHIIDRQQELIASLWDLLARMLGVQKEKLGMLHSGHFTKIYAKYRNHESSHEILKFRNTLIKGSREWLQESFRAYVAKHVREQQVEIGGIPSVHSEVEAYIKLKFKSNGRWAVSWLDQSIGRVPFWAHLYLLVRMGLLNEALEYIQEHAEQLSSSKDSNFFAYFRAWINSSDGRLPKPLRDSLIGEWNARIRDFVTNSKSTPKGDAFKYALYKMIGRCELNIKTIRNSDVIRNTEDYIWFQSILISEESNSVDAAFEKYTLSDFSLTMQKFGKDYFQKTETWFMVLLCCGEFEKAVNELANEQFFAQDALHFSIAMAYLGVLNVPENPRTLPVANTLLSISSLKIGNTEYPTYAFHFARMIALLVRDWIQSNPLEMMQYIYLIGIFGKSLESSKGKDISLSELDSGREYTKYIHSLTKDILTQSGSATILIGQLREDGQGRTPGPVEKYKLLMHLSTEQEFLDRIILSAAEQCDQEGRLKDALELYNLSCQPNKVLELLVRQIGDSLQSRLANTQVSSYEQQVHDDSQSPVETAIRVIDYYMARPYEASILDQRIVYTCRTLITLAKFKKEAECGHLESALTNFYSLDIVPSSVDMNLIQKKASSFNSLDESICRVLPLTLVSVATVLSALYQQISISRSAERESRLTTIKQKMSAILAFCGMIQYQIPGDMFAKMNRLNAMMG